MLLGLEEEGEPGLLVTLLLGLGDGTGSLGNILWILNFPMEVGGLSIVVGGLDTGTLFGGEFWKLPFTSCSREPRMEELPSDFLSFSAFAVDTSLPEIESVLGTEVGMNRGLPTHC